MEKRILLLFTASFLLSFAQAHARSEASDVRSIYRRGLLDILKQCLTTNDCKEDQYCHHEGLNPLGTCNPVKERGEKCLKDRQCRSRKCHLFLCERSEPVRDAFCLKNQHSDCIASQFCARKKGIYRCINRLCRGLCTKHAQCRSDRCFIFWCIWSPKHGTCNA